MCRGRKIQNWYETILAPKFDNIPGPLGPYRFLLKGDISIGENYRMIISPMTEVHWQTQYNPKPYGIHIKKSVLSDVPFSACLGLKNDK